MDAKTSKRNATTAVVIATAWLLAAMLLFPSAGWGARRARAPQLPPQGLYEGCTPGANLGECITHLRQMSAAGFRYVLNYSAWYGTPSQVLSYADAAQAVGMTVIWPLNHPAWRSSTGLAANYPTLPAGCHCDTNAAITQYAINLVKDHPAT